MSASLPMYDTAMTRAANDRFWQLIRTSLGFGPLRLDRSTDPWDLWRAPDLLFSQTCGLPYRTELRDLVTLIGTPDYGLPDCPPGYYRSVIVVRRNDRRTALADFAGARLARNDIRSQSGWAALEAHLQESGAGFSFSDNVDTTGSHAASAQAVLDRRADLAALDAVTWAELKKAQASMDGLRVLCKTRPTPGLPFITAKARDPKSITVAVSAAIQGLPEADRRKLMLKGLVQIPASAYLAEPVPA
ncbi:MAG: phosphate/phosphite/phosphonate ABC transporter substrate-binding protein [Roseobacter sp.]